MTISHKTENIKRLKILWRINGNFRTESYTIIIAEVKNSWGGS